MLQLQVARLLLSTRDSAKLETKLIGIADALSEVRNIPAVDAWAALIAQLRDPECYRGLWQPDLETIRTEIRDLLVYLTKEKQAPAYTYFSDSEVLGQIAEEADAQMGSPVY